MAFFLMFVGIFIFMIGFIVAMNAETGFDMIATLIVFTNSAIFFSVAAVVGAINRFREALPNILKPEQKPPIAPAPEPKPPKLKPEPEPEAQEQRKPFKL